MPDTTNAPNATIGFLDTPDLDDEGQHFLDEDIDEVGYIRNVSRLWAYQPATQYALFDVMRQTLSHYKLSYRQRGILIAACSITQGDSYCALAWGTKLAKASDARTAAGVLRGTDDELTASEQVMARWARRVARDPNATTAADVRELRDAGFTDPQIFTITVFVALRLAFSTVNDSLGVLPDAELRAVAPADVLDAVTCGRPIEGEE